jgi:hypothetical protein
VFQAGFGVPPRDSARRHARFVLLVALSIASLGALCERPTKSTPITRERAIEIARKQVSFNPDSTDAVQVTSEGPGRPTVWRVTFKGRLPDQPPGLFETRIFDIDVRTGEIVGAAMN